MLNGRYTFDQSDRPKKVTILQFEVCFRHGMMYEARVLGQRL